MTQCQHCGREWEDHTSPTGYDYWLNPPKGAWRYGHRYCPNGQLFQPQPSINAHS